MAGENTTSSNVTTLEEASTLFAIDKKTAPDILFITGVVGNIEQKRDGLVEISIAVKRGDETKWVRVAATNPPEGEKGQKLADYFTEKCHKGLFVALGCKAIVKDKYLNIYVRKYRPIFDEK